MVEVRGDGEFPEVGPGDEAMRGIWRCGKENTGVMRRD